MGIYVDCLGRMGEFDGYCIENARAGDHGGGNGYDGRYGDVRSLRLRLAAVYLPDGGLATRLAELDTYVSAVVAFITVRVVGLLRTGGSAMAHRPLSDRVVYYPHQSYSQIPRVVRG